jgi:hypothetical protein
VNTNNKIGMPVLRKFGNWPQLSKRVTLESVSIVVMTSFAWSEGGAVDAEMNWSCHETFNEEIK